MVVLDTRKSPQNDIFLNWTSKIFPKQYIFWSGQNLPKTTIIFLLNFFKKKKNNNVGQSFVFKVFQKNIFLTIQGEIFLNIVRSKTFQNGGGWTLLRLGHSRTIPSKWLPTDHLGRHWLPFLSPPHQLARYQLSKSKSRLDV